MIAKRKPLKPYTLKDVTIIEDAKVRRVIAAAALGNAMEWFDFGVYGYLVTALGKVFFPAVSNSVQLVATFATVSITFIMRPLGGFVFGLLGDRHGRQSVLAATIIIMSISTFCIGLIPSFASIGLWAPLLLLLCKMAQGFSVGGEYTGAAIFIAEYSPDRKRGFWSSFLDFGAFSGFIAGAGVVELLTMVMGPDAIVNWGWRLPFFLALPLGLLGIYFRHELEETPAFQQHTDSLAQDNQAKDAQKPAAPRKSAGQDEADKAVAGTAPRVSFKSILHQYWRALLICVGLVITAMMATHLMLTYMPSYLTGSLGYAPQSGVFIMLVVMVGMLFIQPMIGWMSDRVGRKPFFYAGSIGLILLSIPGFWGIDSGHPWLVFLGLFLFAALMNCFTGVCGSILPAMFPTAVRYSALASAFNIAVVAAGQSPTIMAALVSWTGNLMMPAYFMMGVGGVGLVTSIFMRETANMPLRGSKPMASSLEEAREILLEHYETLEEKIEAIDEEVELLLQRRKRLVEQHPHVD
ncbi:glycine betaine/L-proline transporter ProP [Oecophyllibacter saccharovorans]|uniref:glycine betaine/L-proline transporter ProP n=1 Tax=Oecophyllibacter saccharovorans TaxID=2558360 RepID=UPI001F4F3B09|nr:glycine betaine/L-proline transporter ProP [Oecophyllibacter saccharovorans]